MYTCMYNLYVGARRELDYNAPERPKAAGGMDEDCREKDDSIITINIVIAIMLSLECRHPRWIGGQHAADMTRLQKEMGAFFAATINTGLRLLSGGGVVDRAVVVAVLGVRRRRAFRSLQEW